LLCNTLSFMMSISGTSMRNKVCLKYGGCGSHWTAWLPGWPHCHLAQHDALCAHKVSYTDITLASMLWCCHANSDLQSALCLPLADLATCYQATHAPEPQGCKMVYQHRHRRARAPTDSCDIPHLLLLLFGSSTSALLFLLLLTCLRAAAGSGTRLLP
jgi:hypothetical protein